MAGSVFTGRGGWTDSVIPVDQVRWMGGERIPKREISDPYSLAVILKLIYASDISKR